MVITFLVMWCLQSANCGIQHRVILGVGSGGNCVPLCDCRASSVSPAPATPGNNDRDFGGPEIYEMEENTTTCSFGSEDLGHMRTTGDEEV